MSAEPTRILAVLCSQMTSQQQLCFKQAIVRQTIDYVAQCLPAEADDCGERSLIALAQSWLDRPTAENADRANAAASLDCVDGGVRYFDYPDYFLAPAWAAGADNGVEAAKFALVAAKDRTEIARQWQIATAEAILQGRAYLAIE